MARFEKLTDAEFFAKLAEVPHLDTSEVAARMEAAPLGWTGVSVPGPHATLTIGDHPLRGDETSPRHWVDIPDAVVVTVAAPEPAQADVVDASPNA